MVRFELPAFSEHFSLRTRRASKAPKKVMEFLRCLSVLCLVESASGLQLPMASSSPLMARTAAAVARSAQLSLQEGKKPSVLSDETITNAAAAASGETLWPQAKPKPITPDDTSVGPSEGFDPRIIVYVSLPALVLLGQLFFTFSRDALGDAALGPAVCWSALRRPAQRSATSDFSTPLAMQLLCSPSMVFRLAGHGPVHSAVRVVLLDRMWASPIREPFSRFLAHNVTAS